MSDEGQVTTASMVSTTIPSDHIIAQTPENTTAPFEHIPDSEVIPPPNQIKPKKKRIRLTPKQRAAKIAAGWNPPGPRPAKETDAGIVSVKQVVKPKGPSKADVVLKALVDKLVALENHEQYRSVWRHFFAHGGVYNGPKYVDELRNAIQYLIGTDSEKTTVGE